MASLATQAVRAPAADAEADDAVWRWGVRLTTAGLMLAALSGNWGNIGVPGPADRVVLWLGALVCTVRFHQRGGRLAFKPVHVFMLATLTWAAISAIAVDTLSGEGLYALIDRLVMPFTLYLLTPMIYRTSSARQLLLRVLTVAAGYLSITSMAQFLGVDVLVWPRYILDPNIGIHFERARGPYAEAVANGMVLVVTGVAAGLLAATDRRWQLRWLGAAVVPLAGISVLMTLTRAVWVGMALVLVLVVVFVPKVGKRVLPVSPVLVLLAATLYSHIPGLSQRAQARSGDQWPLWDRLNTNAAAIRMVQERPLTGIGWHKSRDLVHDFVREGPTYPVTSAQIEIHNVFLSRLAELGVFGAGLWLAAMGAALVFPLLRRPEIAELQHWRVLLLSALVVYAVCAMFGPVPYAQPNYLLWCLGGLVMGQYLVAREPRPKSYDQ